MENPGWTYLFSNSNFQTYRSSTKEFEIAQVPRWDLFFFQIPKLFWSDVDNALTWVSTLDLLISNSNF